MWKFQIFEVLNNCVPVKAWGYLNIRRGSLDYIGFFDGRVFVVVGLSLSPFTISSSTKLPSVYNNSEGHPKAFAKSGY